LDSVGVIVPVHGWAPYLAEALDGVLSQSPAPTRVVVVDDGSSPPLRLGDAYASRVQLLRLDRRRGLAGARAAGLEALDDVSLIAPCDGDDTWEPGSLALRVAALRSAPGAALSFGRALIVGPDDRPTGERWEELTPGLHDASSLRAPLFERNPICVSSVVLRRDALLAAGGLDSDLARAEDWELWLRLIAGGAAFVYEPRAVVRYRRRAGGLSADVAELARAQLELHERHADLVDEVTRARVRARDLRALADGSIRERRFADARAALRAAAALGPPPARERALAVALRVPGVRGRLGRRDPSRRRSALRRPAPPAGA
jgi:glycosyltransferase involved in cell wall biosynthesis